MTQGRENCLGSTESYAEQFIQSQIGRIQVRFGVTAKMQSIAYGKYSKWRRSSNFSRINEKKRKNFFLN